MWKQILTLTAAAAMYPMSVQSTSLAKFALDKVLDEASPIFGKYIKNTSRTAEWMKYYADDTLLVHMNIPGTHDSATWNYTQATQNFLLGITDLNQVTVPTPLAFRCQQLSLIDMLNMGIRAFDMRYAFDPTNTTLIFYHSQALLSEKATVNDILFGFYKWLDDHPSETLFLSFQYEGSTALHASNNAAVQLQLYEALTMPAARAYFVQTKDELGTLGQARDNLPGLHFSPTLWTDNSPDIRLVYNTAKNLTAYIEDYYEPQTPFRSTAAENIQWKYNATIANLQRATSNDYADSLFWTWASSENTDNVPYIWPVIQALGNGTEYTPKGGVNDLLVPFLKQQKGKRLGIVMFDFFDQPDELLETFLSL
ncbi:hypothetical protein TSTA_093970 [Talaromyces stipitatus ATCC 10500]|uniref:Phosphatidylinositol-specific phospholipase C X domain-containing protein n=1 Tax=Talaromyces stipitatus (strain ATCC 10500 / CBS 375.48 / QM 6759 / NRRL 1006) TaxID=441959 RepID=B8M1R4_TALSN|nr:uncharacterized protein TSTA_093970 [Talaromyces stipitatus ATCC 10500]EED22151.1 hypothetical protein TSTA_093970 [Talaromyces stipitatus ATCC 10500]